MNHSNSITQSVAVRAWQCNYKNTYYISVLTHILNNYTEEFRVSEKTDSLFKQIYEIWILKNLIEWIENRHENDINI